MGIKKISNEKIVAFDFLADLLKSEFLYNLCMECNLSNIFIEIYAVDSSIKNLYQELVDSKYDAVVIPYKNKYQDVAIRTSLSKLSVFIKIISGYNFDEITIWDGNERWEQHLYLKSAHRKVLLEDNHQFYLCYDSSLKKAELYCSPSYNIENISNIIKESAT